MDYLGNIFFMSCLEEEEEESIQQTENSRNVQFSRFLTFEGRSTDNTADIFQK